MKIPVLLVDNDFDDLFALEATLEPLGLEIVKAESGDEALRAILRRDFALVVMDLMMPGLNGFETCSLIRARDRSRDLPVVILTGFDEEQAKGLPPREAALEAARLLLLEAGPQAVTLKAVSARVSRTHANLLHHFGSAAGLQKALARHMAAAICATIVEAALAHRAGIGSPREVVDLTFDAFGREGGGALASWMLLSGNEDALDPIIEAIHDVVDRLDESDTGALREVTLSLVLLALGDALMGRPLAQSLGLDRDAARGRAEAMLIEAAAQAGLPG
jgi:CheY-like chemotaxis protein